MSDDPYVEGLAAARLWPDKSYGWTRKDALAKLRSLFIPREEFSALKAAADEMAGALGEAEEHFGPFAEITVNGVHDPEDVRVTALVSQALSNYRNLTGGNDEAT